MIYYVTDVDKWSENAKEVEANSPLEAVKKAYPQYNVKRDYNNTGRIVVGGYIETRYGKRYRTYVYEIERNARK